MIIIRDVIIICHVIIHQDENKYKMFVYQSVQDGCGFSNWKHGNIYYFTVTYTTWKCMRFIMKKVIQFEVTENNLQEMKVKEFIQHNHRGDGTFLSTQPHDFGTGGNGGGCTIFSMTSW